MKKVLIAATAVVSAVILMISCSKPNPSAPAQPTGTATVTPSITPTATITETSTDTPVHTATVTPTITPTSTATPPDLYVDDFEDGNVLNAINAWGANTLLGTTIHYQGLITPPPGNGSYAYAVTATANIQAGSTSAYVNLSTGPTSSATPMNAVAYNKLRFGRMLNGVMPSGTKSFGVTIYSDTDFAYYGLGAAFSTNYEEWDMNLRASYSTSGAAIDDILSNIKQINFSVYIEGVPGNTMDFELVIDDVRFTHN